MKILKKQLVAALLLSSAAALLSLSASAADNGLSVYVDGKKIDFDAPPVILSDRTMVPMRAIFEALGAEVTWDDETKTAIGTRGETEIALQVGNDEMRVGKREISLDAAPVIRSDRVLVPARAVAEAFGVSVDWYSEINTVAIYQDDTAVKSTTLYNLDHEAVNVDTNFEKQYRSLGWIPSLDGFYQKMYHASTEADVPLSALEENLDAGWSENPPLISFTDNSHFTVANGIMRLYWHPRNTSGKEILSYVPTVYYVPSDVSVGFRKRTPTVSVSAPDGELLGMTSTMPENCFLEITGIENCNTVLIGEVTVRFKGGSEETFWCGQSVTNGTTWDGTVYDESFVPSSDSGKGAVIYKVYNVDGKEDVMRYDEFLARRAEGWHLTPAHLFYCTDGMTVLAANDCAEQLAADGLTDDVEEIKVEMYRDDGTVERILPQQVDTYLAQGWKMCTEPLRTLYAADGTVRTVGQSEVPAYLEQGWFENRSDVYVTIYAPNESTLEIVRTALDAYLAEGWSIEPVTTVYDSEGHAFVIAKAEKDAYLAEGYLADPSPLYRTVYYPDGSTAQALPYQLAEYAASGWYEFPVTTVYASSGESLVIDASMLSEYLANGWASSPDDFYRWYYSVTGSVRGLIADEGRYLADGWKMMPYPIIVNDAVRMERANFWSQYSYRLYWHPVNHSGKTITSYRVEYYIPDEGEYYQNYEDFTAAVAPGETLGNSQFDDAFLVSVREGCDTVIIGRISMEYDDGEIVSFWCGQAIKLGADSWDGTLYDESFRRLPTDNASGAFRVTPVGVTQ